MVVFVPGGDNEPPFGLVVAGLFAAAEGECGSEPPAVGTHAGGFEHVGFIQARRGIELELVRPQEVKPIPVVRGGMGQIDVRPDGEPLSLGLGGTGDILI